MSAAAALKQPVETARARCAPGLSRARMLLQYVLMLLRMKRQSAFRSAVTPVAGGGSDKWFFLQFPVKHPYLQNRCNSVNSLPIHSGCYQSQSTATQCLSGPIKTNQAY